MRETGFACAVVNVARRRDDPTSDRVPSLERPCPTSRRRRVRPLAGRARIAERARPDRRARPTLRPDVGRPPSARATDASAPRVAIARARAHDAPGAGDPARRRGGARHRVGGGDRTVERARRGGAFCLRRTPRADRARPAAQRRSRLPVHGAQPRAVQAEPLPHPPAADREANLQRARRVRNASFARLPDSAYKNGSGPSSAAHYPPLYYAYEAVAYKLTPSHSELTRLFVMRLATVLLFVVTVALTWLIATELLAVTWARALATGLVALQPKLAFGAGIVNPDLMLVVLSTGALLAALRIVRRGPHARSVISLAVCASAGRAHTSAWLLPASRSPSSRWRSPSGVFARPSVRRWRLGAGALGIMVLSVAIALLWVRGHTHGAAGTGGSGNPPLTGLRSPPIPIVRLAVLPAEAELHGCEDRAVVLRLPAGLHRELLRELRLIQRQLSPGLLRRAAAPVRPRPGGALYDGGRPRGGRSSPTGPSSSSRSPSSPAS